jgi:hypothetical protein
VREIIRAAAVLLFPENHSDWGGAVSISDLQCYYLAKLISVEWPAVVLYALDGMSSTNGFMTVVASGFCPIE